MVDFALFLTVSLLFWIGYERSVEVILRFFFAKPKEIDAFLDSKGFKKYYDAYRGLHDKRIEEIQINSQLTGEQKAKELVKAMKEIPGINTILDDSYKALIKGRDLKKINKWYLGFYVFPLVVGIFLAIFDLGILYALTSGGNLGTLVYDGTISLIGIDFPYVRILDMMITGLIFAGGPDLIHQVLGLIEQQKDKATKTL